MSLLDKLERFPIIKTDRLVINEIKSEDAKDYNRLCLDKELNQYFKDDNPVPTKDTFYDNFYVDIAHNDFKSKECLSLAIRYDSKFIGEVLLYNEEPDKSMELGIRILNKYKGNGFAKETVNGMIGFSFKILGIQKLRLRCMKENVAMKGVQSLFNKVKVDDTFCYFEKINGEL